MVFIVLKKKKNVYKRGLIEQSLYALCVEYTCRYFKNKFLHLCPSHFEHEKKYNHMAVNEWKNSRSYDIQYDEYFTKCWKKVVVHICTYQITCYSRDFNMSIYFFCEIFSFFLFMSPPRNKTKIFLVQSTYLLSCTNNV